MFRSRSFNRSGGEYWGNVNLNLSALGLVFLLNATGKDTLDEVLSNGSPVEEFLSRGGDGEQVFRLEPLTLTNPIVGSQSRPDFGRWGNAIDDEPIDPGNEWIGRRH